MVFVYVASDINTRNTFVMTNKGRKFETNMWRIACEQVSTIQRWNSLG